MPILQTIFTFHRVLPLVRVLAFSTAIGSGLILDMDTQCSVFNRQTRARLDKSIGVRLSVRTDALRDEKPPMFLRLDVGRRSHCKRDRTR